MAIRPNAAASTLVIELDGMAAGTLGKLLPPSYRIDRAATARDGAWVLQAGRTTLLGEMAADLTLSEGGPLLAWINALAAGKLTQSQGLVQVLDANYNVKRRIGFEGAQLTAVELPVLSAADGKTPFTIGLRWQPEKVSDGPGSGKVSRPVANKRKPILASNFRVLGLPFDGSFVTRVALPTLTAKLPAADSRLPSRRYLTVDAGELAIGFARRSTPEVLAWVRKLIDDGQVTEGESLTLGIELLDAALKTVLASVKLDGCSLLACDEARLGGNAENSDGVTLRFAVAQLGLTVAA